MFNDKSLRIRPELVGIHAIDPFMSYDSSGRSIMKLSHLSQALVLKNSEERLTQSGIERELGKYTFSIGPNCDCRILKVIPRYRKSPSKDSIEVSPEIEVIYEDTNTYRIGHFSIPTFGSYQRQFGFDYKLTKEFNRLVPGEHMAKGTVVADSPSKKANGGYAYGVNLNTVFITDSASSEDGFIISDAALRKLDFSIYEKRTIEFGSKKFPLNIYGDENNYKIMPEIGEKIHASGLIMALRDIDPLDVPVSLNTKSVRTVDPIFDESIYARGSDSDEDAGTIVDIKVFKNPTYSTNCYSETTSMLDKYISGLNAFYSDIKNVEKELWVERRKKNWEGDVEIEPDLHRLLVEAYSICDDEFATAEGRKPYKSIRTYRGNPVDEYRIELTIKHDITPNLGFKITSLHGDKGVICKIEKEANMPIDERGIRAEVIANGDTTVSRTNTGRLYQHYFNGVVQNIGITIRNMLDIHTQDVKTVIDNLSNLPDNVITDTFQYLLGFLKLASPVQFKYYSEVTSKDGIFEILTEIVVKDLYLLIKLDDSYDDGEIVELDIVVRNIENSVYRQGKGYLEFVDYKGETKTTKEPIKIAPMYYMLLEKIADTWLSVSSAKINHFGILATTTKVDKYRTPWRASPTRTNGESETRLFLSYAGRETIAEMLDRNSNVGSHRKIYRNILEADKPTDIPVAIDRTKHKLGTTRPQQIIDHVTTCGGFKIKYEPED